MKWEACGRFQTSALNYRVQVYGHTAIDARIQKYATKHTVQATRQSLRLKRQAIEAHEREQFAKQLSHQVQKIEDIQHVQKVALYLENDDEIDPKHIYRFLEAQGVELYLPILEDKKLKFAKAGKRFKKNKFGIDEPIATEVLDSKQLDIIFMPLVGFDKNKNRIGMGGGFYDRTLDFKKHSTDHGKPKLYGLAFDCQQLDKIDTQPWDIKLDAIITPSKIYD